MTDGRLTPPTPANDNLPALAPSPFSKQVEFTPFLHMAGVGAFQSEELVNFVDYYMLKGRMPRPPGETFHLTDDDGEDVWVAAIIETDKRIGEPWGVETYRTEGAALAAICADTYAEAA